jgi:hypothetical protein
VPLTDPADIGALADRKRALELVLTAPIDELEQIGRRHFSPSALRRRRLDERDEQVRGLAIDNFSGLTSGRMIIGMIHRMLTRYASSAYRFERDGGPPADLTRRRLWTILQFNGGRPMSPSSIRDALAGGVHKTRRALLDTDPGN